MANRGLFWFRRDLRRQDNVGLKNARDECEELFTLFVVDDSHTNWPRRCGTRLQFKLDCVQSLRDEIRECGGELIVREGDPEKLVARIASEIGVEKVYWNRTYEPYERKRDDLAQENLSGMGIDTETFKDQVMFETDEILTNGGTPYKVFTPYSDKWKALSKPDPVRTIDQFQSPELPSGTIPTARDLGVPPEIDEIEWDPSRSAAVNCLQRFLEESVEEYDRMREYPGTDGTSKLSPYLRFGLLSVREIISSCRDVFRDTHETDGIETFIEEIIWRDFYHQVLYHNPHVVNENYDEKYDSLDWNENEQWLDAWKRGKTGYPLVDAAMRQLNRTGWMHNRLRMLVAVFLTKHCLIHWKKGERYFMNRLVDGDTAANNGGWQWSASTGTDAVPYFRTFNPITQSEKYDPNGDFIRKYCPELESLDTSQIHAPFECDKKSLKNQGVELGSDYPKPILDYDDRRRIAEETFKSAGSD